MTFSTIAYSGPTSLIALRYSDHSPDLSPSWTPPPRTCPADILTREASCEDIDIREVCEVDVSDVSVDSCVRPLSPEEVLAEVVLLDEPLCLEESCPFESELDSSDSAEK